MPIIHPQAEALVHLARKRRLLDVAGGARLRILLGERNVASVADARRFLSTSALVSASVAAALQALLPADGAMRLGPYQVLAHLADGGMGSVWLATRVGDDGRQATPGLDRPRIGEVVVAKSLHARIAATGEARQRFEREARLMAVLRHPHIVAVRDLEVDLAGAPFLVMDLVEAGDLKDLVEEQGPLPEALALAIIHQMAEALAVANERELIHRDIKPANIFVRPDGWATLADFGMARSTDERRTVLTMEGTVLGSPLYMSPEQIRGAEALDIRSDLYALGGVLYFCLTGQPPYAGDSLQAVLHQHLTAPLPRVRERRPDLGARTVALLERLLAKDRSARPRTPEETCLAASDALAALAGAPMRAATPTPSRMPTPQAEHSTVALAERPFDPLSLLTASGDDGMPPVAPPPEPAQQATLLSEAPAGMDTPWISLSDAHGMLLLYARSELLLGKLCEPPVDVCLRKYPVARHRDDCLRIGRTHLRLRFDAAAGAVAFIDLGSTHGTTVDGLRLVPNHAHGLDPDRPLACLVAGSLNVTVRVHPRDPIDPAGEPAPQAGCGLEQAHAIDACVITRPDNQPGMAYAMVLRRVTIGAPGAHLALPGVSRAVAEIAWQAGRWCWRTSARAPWAALAAGTVVPLDQRRLRAAPGRYEDFLGEV